ncbi:hypothetical protein K438DRAFT_1976869 [Mycena galopus ATCC 62051]|nr:hypothetical protein K438DRAFT_1976869 [Mycena galopus ATCC 62051]
MTTPQTTPVAPARPRPLPELTTAVELAEAFRGVFDCYRELYEKAGMTHGDINFNTIMFRRKDGKIHGVLVDLDDMDEQERRPTSSRNKPYMSLDLLEHCPLPIHPYRFDLEALFYAIVFASCRYSEGKESDFQWWHHSETSTLVVQKRLFFANRIPNPASGFVAFYDMNRFLHRMFRDAYNARIDATTFDGVLDPSFDDNTLGGRVTFDTFERLLDEHLPRAA